MLSATMAMLPLSEARKLACDGAEAMWAYVTQRTSVTPEQEVVFQSLRRSLEYLLELESDPGQAHESDWEEIFQVEYPEVYS